MANNPWSVEDFYLRAAYPDMSQVEIWSIIRVLAEIEPGDQDWSWSSQFDWLELHHWEGLQELRANIAQNGLAKPLLVGPDMRMWDGHHRLWVLYKAQYRYVPLELMPPHTYSPKETREL